MPKIEVEVEGNVANIKTGRNKGTLVNIGSAAEMYLEGYITRSDIVDTLALSAGYLNACQKIKDLEAQLAAAKAK